MGSSAAWSYQEPKAVKLVQLALDRPEGALVEPPLFEDIPEFLCRCPRRAADCDPILARAGAAAYTAHWSGHR